jgi:hypothetical protein
MILITSFIKDNRKDAEKMKKVAQLNGLDQVKNGNDLLDYDRDHDGYGDELLKYVDEIIKVQSKDQLYYNDYSKTKYSELDVEIYKFGGIALYAHPFYDWVDSNINKIGNKLLYAIISNIVPLGENGRRYFINIAMKRKDSFVELMNLYAIMEKMFNEGFIGASTYSELYSLGYKGNYLNGDCPASAALKFGN